MSHSATRSVTAVRANRPAISLVRVALLLWCSALLSISAPVGAQTAAVVQIASGTLDHAQVEGPRWQRDHFDPLGSGTHTVRVTWEGEADVRFSLFERTGGTRIAAPPDYTIPNEWTGVLDGAEQYAISVWTRSGTASYSVTLEAQPDPLVIGSQPADITVTEGDDAVFSVTASGSGTLAYQWSADGVIIPDAVAATLTIDPVALADSGTGYTVQVSDDSGSPVSSTTATLTVQANAPPENAPPEIVTQPADITVTEGDDAVFSVTASGSGTLAYQWLASTSEPSEDDENAVTVNPATEIPGATGNILTIGSVTSTDSGTDYLVEITDEDGFTVTSDIATLTVEPAPLQITVEPADVTVTEGEEAVFSVSATGTGTLGYQWFADDTPIPGATGDTVTVGPTEVADSGTAYTVRITDEDGSTVTSDSATLVVDEVPVTLAIAAQPVDASVVEGDDALFDLTVTGSGELAYQWFVNDSAIGGAITDSLLLSAIPLTMDGSVYRVEVTDDNGTVSSDRATLSVDGAALPVTVVDIGQGTLDVDKNMGPSYVRLDFDSLAGAHHTVTVSWDSDADVRFRVFEADGTALGPVVRDSNPGSWTGELDADASYYIALWSSQGIANYTATLEASVPFMLTSQPVDSIATVGDDVTFDVEAEGSGTLTYQWMADGVAIAGETGDSLTVFAASLDESGTAYTVDVGNDFETVTSDPAILTVEEPLVLGHFSQEADDTTWMLKGPAPTLDYRAGQNTGGWGQVLLRVGDLLLVGGDFQGIRSMRGGPVTARPYLAALDAVSGQPVSTFQVPPEVDGVVRALAISPSRDRVYVGGDFGLLVLDVSTGDLDVGVSVTEGLERGRVFDIAVTSGHVYIGGDFTRVDDTFRANIARLSLDAELDLSWSPNVTNGFEAGRSAPVQSVTVSPDEHTVYVGGNFGFIDGTPVGRTPRDKKVSLLSLDASDGAVRPERFSPDTGNNSKAAFVHDIAVTEFYVIVAWGGPNHLTFHSLAGDLLRQHDSKGDVQVLQVVGDHVFVGHHGEFFGSSQDPVPPEAIESLDPRVIVPYKLHSFRIDDGSFENEQAWRISGAFGVWGIAAAEDSIWVAGQMFLAGTNDRSVDGLVRFSAID